MVKLSNRSSRSVQSDRPDRMNRAGVVAGVVAGLVAGAGLSVLPLSGASAAPNPDMSVGLMPAPVPLSHAGEVTMWGGDDVGQSTVPASLSGVAVSQVVLSNTVTLALTSAGKVVGWGGNLARLQRIPAAVNATPIAQIAAGMDYAGAVTRDGRVLTWGLLSQRPTALNVPAGLSGVKQLVLTKWNGVALKADGTVAAWGDPDTNINQPPTGLKATALAANMDATYALTEQGTVVAWGTNISRQLDVPVEAQQPGNVKAIAATRTGGIALLADNTLVGWGQHYDPLNPLPSWLTPLTPIALTGGGVNQTLGIVDDEGVIHQWSPILSGEVEIPTGLSGGPIAQVALGGNNPIGGAVILTKMLRGDAPKITGTATVGNTLSAIPGTFSATPDSVANQWMADGSPISGATGATLKVTPALSGKTLTYRSTATKTGQTTISSVSAGVKATTPPPAVVGSKITSTKVKVAKKAKKVTVTSKVTASKPPTGRAKVTIKKGKKVITTKTVKVASNGTLKLVVKNFGKLALKKTKSKKKNGYRGKYTLTINYTGNGAVKPSTGNSTFKVK